MARPWSASFPELRPSWSEYREPALGAKADLSLSAHGRVENDPCSFLEQRPSVWVKYGRTRLHSAALARLGCVRQSRSPDELALRHINNGVERSARTSVVCWFADKTAGMRPGVMVLGQATISFYHCLVSSALSHARLSDVISSVG